MNPSNALTHLIELTSNVSDAFTTALYVAQTDQNILRLREHLSLSRNLDPDSAIPVGQGPIGKVALAHEPVAEEYSENAPADLSLYKQPEDVKGRIAIPIQHGGLRAVLVVDTKEQYGFPPKVQKIVSGLAEQMAWHLGKENERRARIAQPVESMHETLEWCRWLAESPDRTALSDRLIQVPETVTVCDAVAVIWFTPGEEAGRVSRFRGWEQEVRTLPVFPGKGFAGSCAKNKKPFLTRNAGKRNVVVFSETENPEPFGAYLAVPVMQGEVVQGVVVSASHNEDGFSQQDLDRWTLMAAFSSSALRCMDIQTQWEYDKNLCQVSGVPNHRFLSTYLNAVESEVFREGRKAYVIAARLNNLHLVYQNHGLDVGDQFLKQVVSLIAKAVNTPKYVFKYTESALILILMDIDLEEARSIRTRLKQIFKNQPFNVDNHPLEAEINFGLAIHPADGPDLGALIGVSLSRAAHT